MNETRFTERAQAALRLAQEGSAELGHGYVGSEHLLLGSQGLTPRCKKIIELSLAEAARLGHHYVGTEHLLLGILREGDGVAVRVLTGMGTEPRRLHADVVAAMGGEASPSPFRGNGKTREREYGGDARLLEQFARDLTRLAAGRRTTPPSSASPAWARPPWPRAWPAGWLPGTCPTSCAPSASWPWISPPWWRAPSTGGNLRSG